MKNNTLYLYSQLFITILLVSTVSHSQSTASYTIVFESVWENENIDPVHGNSTTAIPSNAHWSNLVGATHNSNYIVVEMGSLASTGVQNVAELGNNSALMNEVNTQITNGNANQWLQESFSPFAAISTATLNNIIVSSDYSLLSLVSMIAPSPDWMIAINSVDLRDSNSWKNEIIIPLFPYDAGTDSGATYTAPNQPILPNHLPISALINEGPFNAKPIGTLTIALNQVLSIDEQDEEMVTLFPNPSNGNITINTKNSNPLREVLVYDVLGKLVYIMKNKTPNNQLQLNLSAVQKGVYLIRVELRDGTTATKKVAIN